MSRLEDLKWSFRLVYKEVKLFYPPKELFSEWNMVICQQEIKNKLFPLVDNIGFFNLNSDTYECYGRVYGSDIHEGYCIAHVFGGLPDRIRDNLYIEPLGYSSEHKGYRFIRPVVMSLKLKRSRKFTDWTTYERQAKIESFLSEDS